MIKVESERLVARLVESRPWLGAVAHTPWLTRAVLLWLPLQEFWTGSVTRSLLRRCPAPLVVYRQ